MSALEAGSRKPLARLALGSRGPGREWALILAGGEGVRLRPLVSRICGDERPKQYVPLTGARSLLRQTLERTALLIPPERTIVVSLQQHADWVAAEFRGGPSPTVLLQPQDRGTAAAILLGTHWIARRDPGATVAVFPSDHYILEEQVFMSHAGRVMAFLDRQPEWLVLLGAVPTEPDPEYGWIEPGEAVEAGDGLGLRRVRRFWEKPSPETARVSLATGWLWNTFVFAARAPTLIEAGRRMLPDLHARLARLAAFAGTEHEPWAVRQAYALARAGNFSRAILEPCPPFLAVSRLPACTWSDLGTPARALRVVSTLASPPAWARDLRRPA
jgi:mannose-1-phosphate guanylyltransferase